jgi:type III pantothenate kinase
MNLCIDRGNSTTKIGIFVNDKLFTTKVFKKFGLLQLEQIFSEYFIENVILSGVVDTEIVLKNFLKEKSDFFIELSHETKLPFENRYLTPETLGKDRIAAVAGAAWLKPNADLLVIDAGTAITYDFIDAKGIYHGGNISPGVEMRAKALHQFTSKLPYVVPKEEFTLLGNNTTSAISAGIVQGIVFEIDGYIQTLKFKYPELSTFLTGGSIFYFDKKLKNSIFAEKFLVLFGLNRILQYNVK